MKSYNFTQHIPAMQSTLGSTMNHPLPAANGGESPGMLDMTTTNYHEARRYADEQFWYWRNIKVYEALPQFYGDYWYAYSKIADGRYLRSQMPILNESDMQKLKTLLTAENVKDICEVCKVEAGRLIPIQKQIYFDKSIDKTAEYGVRDTLKFLKSLHIFTDDAYQILDGNHRWLSAMLIDPYTELLLYKIKMPLDKVLPFMLKFSDDNGRVRNG
jgi:hypothetical protein